MRGKSVAAEGVGCEGRGPPSGHDPDEALRVAKHAIGVPPALRGEPLSRHGVRRRSRVPRLPRLPRDGRHTRWPVRHRLAGRTPDYAQLTAGGVSERSPPRGGGAGGGLAERRLALGVRLALAPTPYPSPSGRGGFGPRRSEASACSARWPFPGAPLTHPPSFRRKPESSQASVWIPASAGMMACGWKQPPPACERHVVRGGSWGTIPSQQRLAERMSYVPTDRDDSIGIRLVRDLD
ncbi:SUMF1/EgtB/PvdO family nonheme iron enzyme [Sphingoaurantiacus capsulatus]|uniref:SUMF1/EgtB/PvdO family nonheme iron enzyme n=1 Tax=Sphingoaurantiacus capsulatus TaxID=1771310 RepID=A0ABV7X7W7_9SPHN